MIHVTLNKFSKKYIFLITKSVCFLLKAVETKPGDLSKHNALPGPWSQSTKGRRKKMLYNLQFLINPTS